MTTEEFSNGFDTLVDSYRRFKDFDKMQMLDSIEFNEYEKSVYLTMAQDELVVSLYAGRNSNGDSFESTEEMRRYLDVLVKTENPSVASSNLPGKVSSKSVFYTVPSDVAFIVYEQVTWNDSGLGCYNGSVAAVYPVTHDEYNKVRRNPFRGPSKYKVLRLDAGGGLLELVSEYSFKDYMIRYVSKPKPIITETLENGLTVKGEYEEMGCSLSSDVHDMILKRAVQMALASKGIQVNS